MDAAIAKPEDKIPALAAVYRGLEMTRSYRAMDVLDAIVFAHPMPVSREDVVRHIVGDVNTISGTEWRAWMAALDRTLPAAGYRIACRKGAIRHSGGRVYEYWLERM